MLIDFFPFGPPRDHRAPKKAKKNYLKNTKYLRYPMIKCNIYLTFNHPKTIAPKNSDFFFGGGAAKDDWAP